MLKKLLLATILFHHISSAQILVPAYQVRANAVAQSTINTNLQEFASYGVKITGSTANANTLQWLKNKYTAMGYTASQIQEDTFAYGSGTSKNLVITKQGTLYPNTYVVITGHFDTVAGPGVNDNGSGTAVMLEAARILKDVTTDYSIKFIHFSGEEQGLIGSSHYANNVAFQNGVKQLDIRLVFNLDQVGGKIGQTNTIIKCERDEGGLTNNNAISSTLTNELATCTTLYSPLQTAIAPAYASDYIPFEQKGYAITGFYEYTRSYTEHTSNDTYANVDTTYVMNVAKAAVGAIQHFAVASTSLSTHEIVSSDDFDVQISPNPAKDFFKISTTEKLGDFSVLVYDMSGREVLQAQNTNLIDVKTLSKGQYMVTISTKEGQIHRKILINR